MQQQIIMKKVFFYCYLLVLSYECKRFFVGWRSCAASFLWWRTRYSRGEFIKERLRMALLTFLIHVSIACAAFSRTRILLENLAGKLTPQFSTLFCSPGASFLFISRFDPAAPPDIVPFSLNYFIFIFFKRVYPALRCKHILHLGVSILF